jgi:deoxyribonuclease V
MFFVQTAGKLKEEPDLYIFDGNGYLHPRHMGIATHASMYLKKPTIGVAKSYYKIGNVDFIMPENYDGAYTDIIINNEIYGRAIRTHKNVKPIFVSVGNYIDLETATEIVNRLVTPESHIPMLSISSR